MKKVTSRKGKSKIKNKKIGRDNVPKKGKKKKKKEKKIGRGNVPRKGKEKILAEALCPGKEKKKKKEKRVQVHMSIFVH